MFTDFKPFTVKEICPSHVSGPDGLAHFRGLRSVYDRATDITYVPQLKSSICNKFVTAKGNSSGRVVASFALVRSRQWLLNVD